MNVKCLHGEGSHLIVDCNAENKKKLGDLKFIEKLLLDLTKIIGSRQISKPFVMNYESGKESGVTGFIIITDSHIAIHTYPKKNFLCLDIFSCKEFDVDKVMSFLDKELKIRKVEKKLLSRGLKHNFDIEKNREKIKGFSVRKNMEVSNMVRNMKNMGFQATNLADGVELINRMRREKATIFLTFTSNMVSSGLRELFAQMVKEKMIDVIITTVGSVEEDVIKCGKDFLLGDFDADDTELNRKGINRIGNIFVPNDRYIYLEEFLMPFFEEIAERQEKTGKMISPREIIYELGKRLKDKNSILYWASKNKIPIFCPGITDGAFGLQIYFFKKENPGFGIDVTADMDELAEIVYKSKKTGGIILGGGIAKHQALGVNIVRDGFDYAVYVTTAQEFDGSLSGARPKEAVSWSKIRMEKNTVCVYGDATIIFPLIMAGVMK